MLPQTALQRPLPRFPRAFGFPGLAGLACLLPVLLLGAPLLFGGQTLGGGDILNSYLPYKALVREQLAAGIFPHWNPLTFCGRPLQADIQVGLFYPPNLLFWVLPPTWAFDLSLLGHLWLGALGMALWMRRRTAPLPALLSGLLFMFGGYSTARLLSGVVVFPAAQAWLPWMLLCWDRCRASMVDSGRGRGRDLAALVAVLALSLLAGAPQISFYSFAALGLYALLHALAPAAPEGDSAYDEPAGDESEGTLPFRLRPLAVLAGAFLLAAGLCAVQLLPTSLLVGQSWDRAVGAAWDYVVDGSMRPRMLLTLVSPLFFGHPADEGFYWGQEGYHEVTAYLGPLPLLLLGVFLAGRWTRLRGDWFQGLDAAQTAEARRFERFLLLLLLLTALFAPGRFSPAFWLAYHLVPGFDRFRVPARFLLYFVLALSALSGWTLDRLTRPPDRAEDADGAWFRGPRFLLSLLVLVSGTGVLCVLWRSTGPLGQLLEMPRPADPVRGAADLLRMQSASDNSSLRFLLLWLGAGGLLAACCALRRRPRIQAAVAGLLVLLAAWDLADYGRGFLAAVPRGQVMQTEYARTPRVEFLQKALAGGGRFVWLDSVLSYEVDQFQTELLANRPLLHHMPGLRGYDPVNSRLYGLSMNQAAGRPLEANPRAFLFLPDDVPAPPIDWRLLALWDCRIVLSYQPLESPALQEAARWDFQSGRTWTLHAYRILDPVGPAHLAQPFPCPADAPPEQMLALLGSGRFNPRALALVQEDPFADLTASPAAARAGDASTSSVIVQRQDPGAWVFQVDTPRNTLLVVSQSWYPGWKARVDGVDRPVLRANVAQCAVAVPAGAHTVELEYRPRAFWQGLWISVATLVLLGLLVLRLNRAAGWD